MGKIVKAFIFLILTCNYSFCFSQHSTLTINYNIIGLENHSNKSSFGVSVLYGFVPPINSIKAGKQLMVEVGLSYNMITFEPDLITLFSTAGPTNKPVNQHIYRMEYKEFQLPIEGSYNFLLSENNLTSIYLGGLLSLNTNIYSAMHEEYYEVTSNNSINWSIPSRNFSNPIYLYPGIGIRTFTIFKLKNINLRADAKLQYMTSLNQYYNVNEKYRITLGIGVGF